jgi:hypothetical protein
MGGEMAKIGGWKTISQPSRIVPGASWRDPFFALFEKSSFSAACEAHVHIVTTDGTAEAVPFQNHGYAADSGRLRGTITNTVRWQSEM